MDEGALHDTALGFDGARHLADFVAPVAEPDGNGGIPRGDGAQQAGHAAHGGADGACERGPDRQHDNRDTADENSHVMDGGRASPGGGFPGRVVAQGGGVHQFRDDVLHRLAVGFHLLAGQGVQLPRLLDQFDGGLRDPGADDRHRAGARFQFVGQGAGGQAFHCLVGFGRGVADLIRGRPVAGRHEHHGGRLQPAHREAIAVEGVGGGVVLIRHRLRAAGTNRVGAAQHHAAAREFLGEGLGAGLEHRSVLEQPLLPGHQHVGAQARGLFQGRRRVVQLGQRLIQTRSVAVAFGRFARLTEPLPSGGGGLIGLFGDAVDGGDGLLERQFAADDAELQRGQQALLHLPPQSGLFGDPVL